VAGMSGVIAANVAAKRRPRLCFAGIWQSCRLNY
jgi:hypothetical protein